MEGCGEEGGGREEEGVGIGEEEEEKREEEEEGADEHYTVGYSTTGRVSRNVRMC